MQNLTCSTNTVPYKCTLTEEASSANEDLHHLLLKSSMHHSIRGVQANPLSFV